MNLARAVAFVAAASLAGCAGIPDLQFTNDDASTGAGGDGAPPSTEAGGTTDATATDATTSSETGTAESGADASSDDAGSASDANDGASDDAQASEASTPEAGTDADTCPSLPPTNAVCCGTVPCYGNKCLSGSNCTTCSTTCAGSLCCAKGSSVTCVANPSMCP
jgi:hypothetical protein